MNGLGTTWKVIVKQLYHIVDSYEKINMLMSLFSVGYLRKIAATYISKGKNVYVDAGCGTGLLVEKLFEVTKGKPNFSLIVCMDPLEKMLKSSKLNNSLVDKVIGVFEYFPFRDYSINVISSSFAIRDAMSYPKALSELNRALKYRGSIVLLDLSKPGEDSVWKKLKGLFMYVYFRIIPVFFGMCFFGYKGITLYRGLSVTLLRYWSQEKFLGFLKGLGMSVAKKNFLFGFVHIIVGIKNR